MTWVLIIGFVAATVVAFIVLVDEGYRNRSVIYWVGHEPFNRLQGWLVQPREPDMTRVGYFLFGLLMTVLLMVMRTRFIWWPLHPAGYAVSSSYSMRAFWGLFIIAWVCKWAIVRWGGVRGLRTATPFFMGMILGQMVVGSLWTIVGVILGTRVFTITI